MITFIRKLFKRKSDVKIYLGGSGRVNGLLKMLAWIEFCGQIGHSPEAFKVFADGDGCTQWKFDFEDRLLCKQYCTIKTLLLDDWNQKGRDEQCFEI